MKIKFSPTVLLLCTIIYLGCNPRNPSDSMAPLLSIEESIEDFEIEKGFVAEPVCAEPLVETPVAIRFDEDAAMWVVEMRGYMHDMEGAGEDQPLGRIKIFTDKDGDGKYESAAVFLDSLVMPRAIAIVNGGILLIVPPGLYFVENHQGVAGKKTLLDSAFADVGNVEHQPNGLVMGVDNWYYCATSDKRVKNVNGKWMIEKTQWRGQWGISSDDAGRLYYNNNSVMLMTDNFLPGTFPVNENHRPVSGMVSGVQIAENRVYPRRQTSGVNRGYQQDVLDTEGKLINVTSACGPVVYRGDNFPNEYYGNVFVMEPAAFLIKRILLNRDENGFTKGKFAYPDKEFLTGGDERFRPVNAITGPDGCLYVTDMHRGVIQHTTYMTPYLRRHIDSMKLERPLNMGRIYRIRWEEKSASAPLKLSGYSASELADLLKHPNGHYRDLAQRLLVEKKDTSVAAVLRTLVLSGDTKAALHALWILDGLNSLTPDFLVQAATQTNDTNIYYSCILLFRQFSGRKMALDKLVSLRKKGQRIAEVYFLNSLSPFYKNHFTEAAPLLREIGNSYKNDPLITDAILSGVQGKEELVLQTIVSERDDTLLRKALVKAIAVSKRPREENNISHLSNNEKEFFNNGKGLYIANCSACHGKEGEGMTNIAPPLATSEWITSDNIEIPVRILLDGLAGPITVNGKHYAPPNYFNTMPGLRDNIERNNGDIAAILTYIRNSFGNKGSAISTEEVGKIRAATKGKSQPYTEEELKSIK